MASTAPLGCSGACRFAFVELLLEVEPLFELVERSFEFEPLFEVAERAAFAPVSDDAARDGPRWLHEAANAMATTAQPLRMHRFIP
jgi:hypothetical protein